MAGLARAWRVGLGPAAALALALLWTAAGAQDSLTLAGLTREGFMARMADQGERDDTAGRRWDLAEALIENGSLSGEAATAAFLETPRHVFAREPQPGRAYADVPLPIGYGQTISAPHMVARMTSALAVGPTDRVLEIGTGSGYQAAVLAHLTPHVYTVEIVEPLAAETEQVFAGLEGADYAAIHRRTGDGYYGWPEEAPFDRIIVTAAVDHIPPPLIEQLAVGGRMLIPVGPPDAQVLLEVTKVADADGTVRVERRDVYDGRALVRFVPLTRADGTPWSR